MPPDNQNSPTEVPIETPQLNSNPIRPDSSFNTKLERQQKRKQRVFRISVLISLLLISGAIYMYVNRNEMVKHDMDHHVNNAVTSEAIISLTPSGISPATVSISQGSSVSWTNADTADHSLVFIGHDDLNSEILKPNDSYSATFDEAGTYNYSDPGTKAITGTIIVE